MNKKITFLISSLCGGGAEGVCVTLANELTQRGWQIDLVVLNMKDSVYHERLSKKVNFVVLNINHARYSSYGLAKYLIAKKPQKILVFNYGLTIITVLLKKILKLKTKIVTRNINTLSHKRRQTRGIWGKYVVMPLVSRYFSEAQHIINQCEAMREDLLNIYPTISNKTSVIYNPINTIVQDHAKRMEFKKLKKKEYILCVGRLEEQKALDYAIEGFVQISHKFPNLRLKIVGKGSLEEHLKMCAKKFGVIDRVDFEGFQNDIISYYVGAKATLLTSLYEGFPNVLVESIALGTPVVAFDCQSGPSELIVDDLNGYLVEYQNINDFTNKLVKTLLKKWDYTEVAKSVENLRIENIVSLYEDKIDDVN